jgi:hypothetical protein
MSKCNDVAQISGEVLNSSAGQVKALRNVLVFYTDF